MKVFDIKCKTRDRRNEVIKENKIELTKKIPIPSICFSILTDKIFDYVREYLAAFVINSFRQYEGRTRTSCEVWLKNEGLSVRESVMNYITVL